MRYLGTVRFRVLGGVELIICDWSSSCVVGVQDIAMGPVVPTMFQPLSSGTAS
jgi:hypothetical protein